MEITKEQLIEGKTVLVDKNSSKRRLYLGNAGLAHFLTLDNDLKKAAGYYWTIEELNTRFFIEQEKSLTVPLERKVYDFVPVRYRSSDNTDWSNGELLAVTPNESYPYCIIDEDGDFDTYRICEFINPQQ